MEMGTLGRKLRLGVLGLGNRGTTQLDVLLSMPDVEIVCVCDVYEDRVLKAQQQVELARGTKPLGTLLDLEVLKRDDIEAVMIFTDWASHIRLAILAMQHGKHAAMEVGGASSIDECFTLVRTAEATGKTCMLLENCCYGQEEMSLLNMVREGLFGTLVHCRGAYAHDLRDEAGMGDINRHYRQRNFLARNGELYPTHELGPIFKYLDIHRGNRLLTLSSVASKAVGLAAWLQAERPELPCPRVNCGDVVTTTLTCANGETILLTHDCTLPRPYSRGGLVQGTKGIWMEDNSSIYVEGRTPADPTHWTHRWESDSAYMKEFEHPLWASYRAFGLRGGHGGMDYLVLRSFVECVQQGIPAPIDVYDTAALMAVTTLSEQSISLGSMPVPVPDFTNGRWYEVRAKNEGMYALD